MTGRIIELGELLWKTIEGNSVSEGLRDRKLDDIQLDTLVRPIVFSRRVML